MAKNQVEWPSGRCVALCVAMCQPSAHSHSGGALASLHIHQLHLEHERAVGRDGAPDARRAVSLQDSGAVWRCREEMGREARQEEPRIPGAAPAAQPLAAAPTIAGGMVSRRLSPTRMPSTPRSQPAGRCSTPGSAGKPCPGEAAAAAQPCCMWDAVASSLRHAGLPSHSHPFHPLSTRSHPPMARK